MRAASLTMWPCRLSAMNGSATSMATKIARIFGTKASVISWIWVSAWTSDMTTPTMSPISISGLETITSVRIASRATSSTSDPVMAQTSASLAGGRQRGRSSSDRHPHDLFVGLDHAVAHRDERLDRHFGFRHRRDHVDDVGLARHHRALLRVRGLAGLEHAADRILEQRAKARTLGFAERFAETRGRISDAGEAGIGIGGSRWRCHESPPDQAFRMSSVRWIMRRVTPMTLTFAS